jgi:stage II sporulation protein D
MRFFAAAIIHYSLFIIHYEASAEFIRVGIFTDVKSSQYVFIAANCDYLITADNQKMMTIKKDESITFQLSDGVIIGKYKDQTIGKFARIKCASIDKDGFFRLKSTKPETSALPFPDFLEVSVYKERLNAINVVDLEKYVSSVVEAEAGDNTNSEFLKVQAIICRTFALGHLTRHLSQGYQVCDNIHCQVFLSKSRFNPAVQEAVEQTRNIVIADSKNHLITGAFHSNCGGQTANAKDAWSTYVPCLKSVRDTFCLHSPHAVWQKTIAKKTWVNYLRKKNIPVADSLLSDSSFTFIQSSRENNYCFNTDTISLKSIRYDFKLKSTYFNILPQSGDSLLFQGFGYGHGVGLCQEGAMKMADYGYKMKDIINFYFKGISLVNYDTIKFLKEK